MKKHYFPVSHLLLFVSVVLFYSCSKSIDNSAERRNPVGIKELASTEVGVEVPEQPHGNQSVTGGGTAEELGEISTIVFNAVKKSDGSVTGHLVYHDRAEDVTFEADINCVTIDGNQARLTGILTKTFGPNADQSIPVGSMVTFFVMDNGEGNGAPPDQVSNLYYTTNVLCNVMRPDLIYIPINGNIQIKP